MASSSTIDHEQQRYNPYSTQQQRQFTNNDHDMLETTRRIILLMQNDSSSVFSFAKESKIAKIVSENIRTFVQRAEERTTREAKNMFRMDCETILRHITEFERNTQEAMFKLQERISQAEQTLSLLKQRQCASRTPHSRTYQRR